MKLVTVIFLVFLLISCGLDKKQFEFAGGSFKMAIDNTPTTFIAREATDVYSFELLSQVMEGLVSFNPEDLSLQPQIAEKWNISEDGTVFTFTIRNDILFHENEVFESEKDRKLTVEDVLFTFEKACKPNTEGNPTAAYLLLLADQVKGAKQFYEGKAKTISGIKIKKNQIEITLLNPDQTYINKLANLNASIVSKKVVQANKETDVVGTGPFRFTKPINETSFVLLKNSDYYLVDNKGNALPYLDSVILYVQPHKLKQLKLFEQGKISIINGLPTSRITEMLEGRISDFNAQPPLIVLYNNPLLVTQYYFFNMNEPRFQDVRVRKAFNYALDRKRLADNVLRNQYYEYGIYGITPPVSSVFKGYDFSEIKKYGYDYNPKLAKQLLAEAGYPDGKGFGSVNLRVDISDLNTAVAEDISDQIYQTLGINVNIDGSDFEQWNEDGNMARGDLFRTAWIADYSSPETFLANFYGKLVPKNPRLPSAGNQSRYINPLFDSYFEQARAAGQKGRLELFSKAEIELLKNPPMILLWYANDFTLSYSRVRNLRNNPMEFLDLRRVYIRDWTKEEYLKSIQ
ncbi:peptide ABC transporter substrate-binding protein [Fluviicola sp.]|jgi:ABC-type transport system substrate-binding protein|uniref:ABC transporter substrate-binding protein n=1 Tax=Fluviicola sp. TaxID=1917219 RepID=UPI0028370F86|nr:peptide ABC transporter substrate-binding protein [Fluviicola sp.]MDR0802643.1 peptide ABC transporter substrate-binding protein [Fluviicola sp.]